MNMKEIHFFYLHNRSDRHSATIKIIIFRAPQHRCRTENDSEIEWNRFRFVWDAKATTFPSQWMYKNKGGNRMAYVAYTNGCCFCFACNRKQKVSNVSLFLCTLIKNKMENLAGLIAGTASLQFTKFSLSTSHSFCSLPSQRKNKQTYGCIVHRRDFSQTMWQCDWAKSSDYNRLMGNIRFCRIKLFTVAHISAHVLVTANKYCHVLLFIVRLYWCNCRYDRGK